MYICVATADFDTLASARTHFLSDPTVELCTDLCIRRVESGAPPPDDPRLLNISTNDDDVVLHQYWYVTLCGVVFSLCLLYTTENITLNNDLGVAKLATSNKMLDRGICSAGQARGWSSMMI